MNRVATISINFMDGTKEILSADYGTNILYLAIEAASNNRPIFFLTSGIGGYQIQVLYPDRTRHSYVSGLRNGEYKWCNDFTYAKCFSKKTALKHIYNLYGLKN